MRRSYESWLAQTRCDWHNTVGLGDHRTEAVSDCPARARPSLVFFQAGVRCTDRSQHWNRLYGIGARPLNYSLSKFSRLEIKIATQHDLVAIDERHSTHADHRAVGGRDETKRLVAIIPDQSTTWNELRSKVKLGGRDIS